MSMLKAPKEITPATLDCLVMPNGEILCQGTSIGWVSAFGKWLIPKEAVDKGDGEAR